MAVDDAALERLRDDLLAAIRDSEHRIRGEFADAISSSEAHLGTRIDASAAHLDAKIDASAARLDAKIDASAARLDAKIDASAAHLDARIDASAAETRRHMGVLAEGLKSDIALVAEGVITLTERLSTEMREGVVVLDRRLLRVEARLLATPERS